MSFTITFKRLPNGRYKCDTCHQDFARTSMPAHRLGCEVAKSEQRRANGAKKCPKCELFYFAGPSINSHLVAAHGIHPEQEDEGARPRDKRGRFLGNPRVALAFNEAMTRHINIPYPRHVEKPERITAIMAELAKAGLLERPEVLRVESRRATDEEICLVHDAAYFDRLRQSANLTQAELNDMAERYNSIYICPESFDAALLACGNLLSVLDSVLDPDEDSARGGVAVIRPPGHHAETDEACGFCLINNVAVAAKYALVEKGVKSILIFDFDVHHGNGIQSKFIDDPRVLYVSVHRYDHGKFFPGKKEANYDFVGAGAGKGFNVNIPWNGAGMGDPEYASAFFNVVLPVARKFDPELVLVSAGFDAAINDPLGKCQVSPEMYGLMTRQLMSLADGKVVLALEGGYNLNSTSLSMTLCLKALLGDALPLVPFSDVTPKPSAVESIRNVLGAHAKYWRKSLSEDVRPLESFVELRAHLPDVAVNNADSSFNTLSTNKSAQLEESDPVVMKDVTGMTNNSAPNAKFRSDDEKAPVKHQGRKRKAGTRILRDLEASRATRSSSSTTTRTRTSPPISTRSLRSQSQSGANGHSATPTSRTCLRSSDLATDLATDPASGTASVDDHTTREGEVQSEISALEQKPKERNRGLLENVSGMCAPVAQDRSTDAEEAMDAEVAMDAEEEE